MNLLGEELRITENCFSANEEYRVEGLTDSAIESNIRDAKILFSLWNLKDKQWVYEHYVPALEDHIPMLGNEIDFRETLGVINNLKTVNFPVSLLPRPDRGLESFLAYWSFSKGILDDHSRRSSYPRRSDCVPILRESLHFQ